MLVLHWRGIDKTRQCLTSLRKTSYQNYNVLLVDNGSDLLDGAQLEKEFPEITLLRLEENFGFAGGCNRGMAYAMAHGADFIWLLNNDALAEEHSIELLVKAAGQNEKSGALGALVVEGNHQEAEEAGLGQINFKRAKTYLRKITGASNGGSTGAPTGALAGASAGTSTGASTETSTGTSNSPDTEKTFSCQWLSGSNLLLRAEALRDVGLFDEKYFLYFEDVDLCHRLVLGGYQCLLVPGSTILHEGNASTPGGLSLWRTYYHTRNRLLFFMHYTRGIDKAMAFVSIWAHFLRHCISLPLKGARGRARLKAEWLGLCDYFGDRLGRAECLDWCEKVKF